MRYKPGTIVASDINQELEDITFLIKLVDYYEDEKTPLLWLCSEDSFFSDEITPSVATNPRYPEEVSSVKFYTDIFT